MNQNTTKKIETAAVVVSPIVIIAGVSAVAAIGYFLWTNRSKIQKFVKEQNLPETLSHMSNVVSEGTTKISGFINHDVKPLSNGLHTAAKEVEKTVSHKM
jgi:phage major head subunit gpT-like protein